MPRQLAPDHEAVVERMVASGQYGEADQVIGEALRLLEEHERLQQLRAKLTIGLDQLDRGEGIPFAAEWSADRVRVARERAAAGALPHPDVCP